MIGWELVGLCSFMLIGHWWEEGVNSSAAIKAFLTTRFGDVGLMLGIITLFFAAGRNFDIEHLNHAALTGEIGHGAAPGRRRPPLPRRDGQERPVPPPRVAARRHGRPHARCPP